MPSLSVVIITKNEAQNIRACLQSVAWADEIIVVDSGSTDDTVAICREFTPHVYSHDWPGFGPQKNRALDYATGEWVLSLDADERISPELRKELQDAMAAPGAATAFRIPRLSSFCGRFMHHSGWWPDYVVRLFKRGSARFSDDLVHERVLVDGVTGTLASPILHDTYRDLEEVLDKINRYSTAGAHMLHQKQKNVGLSTAVVHGLWAFVRTYFLRLGLLDGREGFMVAVSNAEGTYYRYVKLMLLNRKRLGRIGVIVTTYNCSVALAAVLEGYLAQTDSDFELVVADDGSTEETAEVVRQYQARAPFTIRHVWHEDQGFRAAAIRNRALAATHAEYIIFTDGDCIPPTNFVACQRALAEPGWFLAGNRLMLAADFTARVLREKLPIHRWRFTDWMRALWRGQIKRLLPLIHLPRMAPLRKLEPRRWEGAKTCNLSAFRSDLLNVNGLDESYTGWGLEDSDLVVRLIHAGVHHKSARFSAPLFHLWHRESDRSGLEENRKRLDAVIRSSCTRATLGVDQYL